MNHRDQFINLDEFLEFLNLDKRNAPYHVLESPHFPFSVSFSYVQKIRKRDWFDPLLLQVVPREEERKTLAGYSEDAVGDLPSMTSPGLLHKYRSRALLMLTLSCAGHCRFCFRRSFPPFSLKDNLPQALEYLGEHPEISEVVLSGGEPLCLSNMELQRLLDSLEETPHIQTIRFHTRALVTMPSRFDDEFMDILDKVQERRKCVFVSHINHPQELDRLSIQTAGRLFSMGVLQLSQTVLLKGVNDCADVLERLFSSLVQMNIVPYYLHQLDRVNGTAHFEVDSESGLKLMRELRVRLPGYAVPRFVKEVAGKAYKVPLF
ncbi:MAG: KamA family radical SAM protein [Chitinispirillaceae bacterium]